MKTNILTALALGCALVNLQAEDAPKKTWETSAAVGLTLTKGNSETFLATLTLDTKRKWDHDEVSAGLAFGYGESEVTDSAGVTTTDKNTDFGAAFGQYNHLFNERLYGGLRLDAGYDDIAGVDYRFKVSPLVGYYFVKNEKTSLAAEAGPSFVFEKLQGSGDDSFVALRIGERFEHKLTKTTRVWQSAEYLPDVSDWTVKYLVNAELGIEAAISTQLGLQVVLQDNYDSQPASGREHNDVRLIAGVKYKF